MLLEFDKLKVKNLQLYKKITSLVILQDGFKIEVDSFLDFEIFRTVYSTEYLWLLV